MFSFWGNVFANINVEKNIPSNIILIFYDLSNNLSNDIDEW